MSDSEYIYVLDDEDDFNDDNILILRRIRNNKLDDNMLMITNNAPGKKKKPRVIKKKIEIKDNDELDDLSELISDKSDKLCGSDIKGKNKCRLCNGSLNVDFASAIVVCSLCGFEQENLLDNGPELRKYNNDDSKTEDNDRFGAPSNFFFPKSSQGTTISGYMPKHLREKDKWAQTFHKETELGHDVERIAKNCANQPLKVQESTKYFFKILKDCKYLDDTNHEKNIIIRGNNKDALLAACNHCGYEVNGLVPNKEKIKKAWNIDDAKLTKGINQLEKFIKNNGDDIHILDRIEAPSFESHVRARAEDLELSKKHQDLAIKISKNAQKLMRVSEHDPESVSAGAVLLVSDLKNLGLDKEEIALAFNTSEATINKVLKKIDTPALRMALVNDELTDFLLKDLKKKKGKKN